MRDIQQTRSGRSLSRFGFRTNEGHPVRIAKRMVHQELCIDATILVAGTGGCQDRFVDLEIVEERSGSILSLGNLIVRGARS